jgi:4-phospho-D-threonate 3-dehydrogenase / 4-phospho-D-erythronate 3-dehydrogenase
MRVRIGVTVGDPAGIGPEIARKAAAHPELADVCDIRLYGPSSDDELRAFERGRVSAAAGRAAYDAIVRPSGTRRAGAIDAIATAPVNKAAFAAAGLPWKGHTDLLAHLTGAPRVAMLFSCRRAPCRARDGARAAPGRVGPADARAARRRDRTDGFVELPRFGIPSPRLALAGLNPHAGEDGLIGTEDRDVLAPSVAACRERGIEIAGTVPGRHRLRPGAQGGIRRRRGLLP